MKHIFIIHSHTVFLTAMGVVELERIPFSDVIFVYGRNYKQSLIELPFKTYDISDCYERCKSILLSVSKRVLISYSGIRKETECVDNFIEKEVNDDFIAYLPHLSFPLFQLFATNKRCTNCRFLQEGGKYVVSSMIGNDPWIIRFYNWFFLRHNKRLWRTNKWMIPQIKRYVDYSIETYSIDNKFFGHFKAPNHIVSWPVPNTSLVDFNHNDPIFVYEGIIELGAIERDIYMKSIKKQIMECAKKHNYVRFHPNQKPNDIETIKSFFTDIEVEYEELAPQIPFEVLLIQNKNLKVYGHSSSLLFFARSLGHQVVSYENDLLSSKMYIRYLERNLGPVKEVVF